MSSQIYWCVEFGRSWGKTKMWPLRFYKTAHEAKMEAMDWDKSFPDKKAFVKRVMLKTKNATHYDVYEHEVKMIHK